MRKTLLVLALCAISVSQLSAQITERKFNYYDNPDQYNREAIEGSGKCVAMTKAGEVYVAATTQIPDSGITVALIKFASDGKIEWTTTLKEFYLGSDMERTYVPMSLALDSIENIHVVGYENTDWANYNGSYYKFAPNGKLMYSNGFLEHRGSGTETHHHQLNDVAIGEKGFVYAAGFQFDDEVLIAKFQDSLAYPYFVVFDSSYSQSADHILYDGKGNLYVSITRSVDADHSTNTDVELLKYDTTGKYIWGRVYPRSTETGYAWNQEIHLGTDGNIYQLVNDFNRVTKKTQARLLVYTETGMPVFKKNIADLGINATQTSASAMDIMDDGTTIITGETISQNGDRLFTLALDKTGKQKWLQTYTDSTGDAVSNPTDMAVDSVGNIYISAQTQYISSGKAASTMLRYTSRGKLMWVNNLSPNNDDSLAFLPLWTGVDKQGFVYTVGQEEELNLGFDGGNIFWTRLEQNLKQDTTLIDTTHSGIVHLTDKQLPLRAFPNPASNIVHLSFELPHSSSLVIELVNMTGQVFRNNTVSGCKGNNVISFLTADLLPGIYLCRITDRILGYSSSARIVILK